jgi:CubicO group peptidase (beta-lactamase class C family)
MGSDEALPSASAPVCFRRGATCRLDPKPQPTKIPTLFFSRVLLLTAILLGSSLGLDRSVAQNDAAPESLDRPPVAAPTSKIQVGAIPVVLSTSQEIDNFTSGLIQGLLADGRPTGVGVFMVQDDHVMLQHNLGMVGPDTRFAADGLSDLLDTIAAMQLVERGKLATNADIGTALGEAAPRGVTVEQVLAHQAGNPALLARVIEKVSGMKLGDYIAKEIAAPLDMKATVSRDGRLETTMTDLSHLVVALANEGAFQNMRILQPATVDLMERTHFAPHPALPGWAYGFAELRRHGWRGLQRDGRTGAFAWRLVVVPEAKLGYLLIARGRTGAPFWRALDDGLLDKSLPPHAAAEAEPSIAAAAPDLAAARGVAGVYESALSGSFSLAVLKRGDRRLIAGAGSDGALILSGAENATLAPRPGGYWGTADGNLNAVPVGGRLLLTTGAYRPLALYKRPQTFAWLALLAALGAAAAFIYEKRRKLVRVFPSDSVLAVAATSIVFLLLCVLTWLLAPTA